MVSRKLFCIMAGLAIGIVTVGAKNFKKHSGQVIDVDSKQPLGAKVSAWRLVPSTGFVDGCPTYGQAIDAKVADASTGRFALEVDADEGDYKTTTCLNDYYPRTDDPQDKDKDTVSPNPVKILHRADANAYRRTMRSEVEAFVADMRYLRSSRPEDFKQLAFDKEFLQGFKNPDDRETARRILADLEVELYRRK